MPDHTKLLVWRKAIDLAVRIHQLRVARGIAPGLHDQLCRAAAAIPANLAEGAAHGPVKNAHHVEIAIGEARELESHLTLGLSLRAFRVGNIPQVVEDTIEVRKMMYGLRNYLRKSGRNLTV